MPKLIVQRSGERRKVPPCGRLIEYVEPRSPFQKLIDAARRRYGLSGRELARKISTNRRPVSQSTLWIWLHNLNGYPHPKSFFPEHVDKLSQVLKIPRAKITRALDASRHIFTPTEDPMPHKHFDSFRRFIDIIENDRRTTVSRAYVLHLAKDLYRGAKKAKH
jgi:transcriptional regulator with XRE-family HTH domain